MILFPLKQMHIAQSLLFQKASTALACAGVLREQLHQYLHKAEMCPATENQAEVSSRMNQNKLMCLRSDIWDEDNEQVCSVVTSSSGEKPGTVGRRQADRSTTYCWSFWKGRQMFSFIFPFSFCCWVMNKKWHSGGTGWNLSVGAVLSC